MRKSRTTFLRKGFDQQVFKFWRLQTFANLLRCLQTLSNLDLSISTKPLVIKFILDCLPIPISSWVYRIDKLFNDSTLSCIKAI